MDEFGFFNMFLSVKKQKLNLFLKKVGGVLLVEFENDSFMLDMLEKVVFKNKKIVIQMYQKFLQIEYIIKCLDIYIGFVERIEQQMWVFNREISLMEFCVVNFVFGLYKIFDEILVNVVDNK